MKWLWTGSNKANKKMKVETINEPVPKKETKFGLKFEVVMEHPCSSSAFTSMVDSKVQFVLPEQSRVINCKLTHIDVLS